MIFENLYEQGLGGFADDYYWSSSEYNSLIAWAQFFISGSQNGNGKSSNVRVRPVRAF